MWELPIIFLFISSFPETIVLTMLSFSFARLKFNSLPIVLIGLAEAIIAYFVRKLPVYFGIHTLILVMTLGSMLYIYKRENGLRVFASALYSMLVLMTLDFGFLYLINWLWPNYYVIAKSNNILWAMSSYPYISIMLVIAFVLNRRNSKSF